MVLTSIKAGTLVTTVNVVWVPVLMNSHRMV